MKSFLTILKPPQNGFLMKSNKHDYHAGIKETHFFFLNVCSSGVKHVLKRNKKIVSEMCEEEKIREREEGRGSTAEKAKYWGCYRLTDQETKGIRDDMEAN